MLRDDQVVEEDGDYTIGVGLRLRSLSDDGLGGALLCNGPPGSDYKQGQGQCRPEPTMYIHEIGNRQLKLAHWEMINQ